MTNATNPLKWLLAELPAYLTPEQHARLMAAYETNKRRYELQIKIRRWERMVKTAERFPPSEQRDAQLTRWRSKLAELKVMEADNA